MTPDFIVRGAIELHRAFEGAGRASFDAPPTQQGRLARLVGPGFDVAWDPTRARHASGDGAACVVWGRPRRIGAGSKLDAAALLALLRASGPAAIEALDGGFGVFFVDRASGCVLLAVDRFSRETLCYGTGGATLAFSDRADAVPVATRTLTRQGLHDYAWFHAIPAPATIYAEVSRLEHGTLLHLHDGGLSRIAYWQPRFAADASQPLEARSRSFVDAVQACTAAEIDAGDIVGCFLSGGTDSSTVAGMIGRVTGRPATTYSIGFDEPGYDEMEYARLTARHFGTSHHEYYVTAEDVLSAVPALAASCDQPFGNSSLIPAYYCARMAAADGITRMMAGDGGDELFGGNTRYRLQAALDLYRYVPQRVREGVLQPVAARLAGRPSVPGVRHLAAYVRAAAVPMPDRLESHNLLSRIGQERIFAPELLDAVDAGKAQDGQRATWRSGSGGDIVDRMLQYDWKYTLADTDLPKVRTAVTLAGLSVGYPLLGDAMVQQCLGLPPRYKVRGTSLRWFFKKALRQFLPAATLKKKKHGFGMPFGRWALRNARLLDLAGDSLAGLESRDILHRGFRDELIRSLLPSAPGYYGELLYILMMLEQWLAAPRPIVACTEDRSPLGTLAA